MSITVKKSEEIDAMRIAGKITGQVLDLMEKSVCAGISTQELDAIAEDFIRSKGAIPSFKGYYGYPASICASVNETVIHGIPNYRRLKDGDIISIDVGAYINGFHGDAARTFAVGNVSPASKRLIEVTRESFFKGIEKARAGNYLSAVSAAVQEYAEGCGFSVVRDYVGHGIGRNMHEDPNIPNYKTGKRGPMLKKGMTLAVEPMITAGTYKVKTLADRWTVVTRDGSMAAHYENTILITDGEPEILTLGEAD